MDIIYRMKSLAASKKRIPYRLDQSGVWHAMIFVLILSGPNTHATNISAIRYGDVVINKRSKVTYFFSESARKMSYVVSYANGERFVHIKEGQDSYQFQIKNNTVKNAIVEKWVRGFRVTANFFLKGKNYHIEKIRFTNKFLFAEDGSCPNPESPMQSSLNSIKATVDNALMNSFGPDVPEVAAPKSNACSTLKKNESDRIDNLTEFFTKETDKNKSLQSCIADKDLPKKIITFEKEKDKKKFEMSIGDINKSVARVKSLLDANEIKKSVNIGCKLNSDPKSTNPAIFNLASNEIDITLTKSKDGQIAILDFANIDANLLHEFAHAALAQPSLYCAETEDQFATAFAYVCGGFPVHNRSGGNDRIDSLFDSIVSPSDNPLGFEASKKDIAELAANKKIVITTALAQIPEQKVAPESIPFAEDMVVNSPGPAANQVVEAAVSSPMRKFSGFIDSTADLFIPSARAAQVEPTFVSQSQKTNFTQDTALSAPQPILENTIYAAPTAQNPERLVEEDILPATTTSPKQLSGNNSTRPARAPASDGIAVRKDSQARPGAGSPGGSNAGSRYTSGDSSMLPLSPALAGSSYDRDLRQQLQSGGTSGKNQFSAPVDGILFSSHNVVAKEYDAYSVKLRREPRFKGDVEKYGILIANTSGHVVTSPKKTRAFFVDTGKALIFRDSQ